MFIPTKPSVDEKKVRGGLIKTGGRGLETDNSFDLALPRPYPKCKNALFYQGQFRADKKVRIYNLF